ncbi:YxiG-like protein [Herbidospora sp. RD11066]
MDAADLQRALDEIFDMGLRRHGFTPYMRDYEFVVDMASDVVPSQRRYLFRHCVQVSVVSAVRTETWKESLDDRLTVYETGVDLDGYVWGVEWQELYPGGTIVEDSPAARRWAEAIGIDFHEVRFETNAHDITLIFSDLLVEELPE